MKRPLNEPGAVQSISAHFLPIKSSFPIATWEELHKEGARNELERELELISIEFPADRTWFLAR